MRKKRRIFLCCLMTLLMAFVMAVPMSVSAAENVAKIGNTEYETIQAAVDAINASDSKNGQIDVIANSTENIKIPTGVTVTLNLAEGVVISGGSIKDNGKAHTITNGGTLTITGGGTLENTQSGSGVLFNNVSATAELNGCTYTGTSWYVIKNLGDMTIDGATITQQDAGSSSIDNGWYGNGTSNDCGVGYPSDNSYVAKLTIEDGTFSGGMNTVKNDDYGWLEINGGSFSNTDGPTVLNWNVATINDGEFTVNNSSKSVIANGYLDDIVDKGQLTITGGEFMSSNDGEGSIFGYGDGSNDGGSVAISGGLFTGKVEVSEKYPYMPAISGGVYTSEVPSAYVNEGLAEISYYDSVDKEKVYIIGTVDEINYVLDELLQKGDSIDVITGDIALDIYVTGVNITNSGGGAVTVNDVPVDKDDTVTTVEQEGNEPEEPSVEPTTPAETTHTEAATTDTTVNEVQTGDDSHMGIVLIMMTLAAAVAVGAVTVKRKAN